MTDPSHIGDDCMPGGPNCPTGYECGVFSGIIADWMCMIDCTTDCDCPQTTSCQEWRDKAGVHHSCAPLAE